MSKTLTYAGTFKQHLLMDELLATFPEWLVGEGDGRQCFLGLEGNVQGVRLTVPDAADDGEIQAVIDAHDPNALSVGEQNEVERDQDDQDLAGRYVVAMSFLDTAIADWPSMTGTQKQQWLANNFDEVLKIIRALLKFVKWLLRS